MTDPIDTAIGDWARSVRLTDAKADSIFAAVVGTPAAVLPLWPEPEAGSEPEAEPGVDSPLGARWWRRQSADLAAVMVQSTRWALAA